MRILLRLHCSAVERELSLPVPLLIARLDLSATSADPSATADRSALEARSVQSLIDRGADAVTVVAPGQAAGWSGTWFYVDDESVVDDRDRGRVVGQVAAAVFGGATAVCCRDPRPVRRALDALFQVSCYEARPGSG